MSRKHGRFQSPAQTQLNEINESMHETESSMKIQFLTDHHDATTEHRAEMVTHEPVGPSQKVYIMSALEREGYFLKTRYRGRVYASEGYMPRLTTARIRCAKFFAHVKEFAKAGAVSAVLFAPMLLPGGGL